MRMGITYVPVLCGACRFLALARTDVESREFVCPGCLRLATVVAEPVLDEGAVDWMRRLSVSLRAVCLPVPPITIDVLRLLVKRTDIDRDDVAYLLRQFAHLEGLDLPRTTADVNAAVKMLIALFEAAARAELMRSGTRPTFDCPPETNRVAEGSAQNSRRRR